MDISNQSSFTTLWDLLCKGGWIMIPLLGLSIIAIYIVLERWLVLNKSLHAPQSWLVTIEEKIRIRAFADLQALFGNSSKVIAKILQKGLFSLDQPPTGLRNAIERAAQEEVYKLERGLTLLGTIASTAPMLGFLGTVTGMIRAFMVIAEEAHQVAPQQLASGIYEAMLTTAVGLLVGLVAKWGYNYLQARIQNATHQIEARAEWCIAILMKAQHATETPKKQTDEA